MLSAILCMVNDSNVAWISSGVTETLYDLFLMKNKKKYLLLLGFASNLFSYEEIEKDDSILIIAQKT